MNKFRAILYDTFLEAKDRKIFYLYWVVTIIMVLVFALMPSMQINGQEIFHQGTGDDSSGGLFDQSMIANIIAHFFDGFLGFMIFLMVFGSAGLVPSFLGKGRVELVLAKPIDRYRLMAMKFLAVYIVTAAVLAMATTLIWLTLSLRLGMADPHFFFGLAFALMQFLLVYAIVFALGIVSNSAAVAIMGYFMLRIATDLLSGREVVYPFLGKSIWKTVLDTLYHLLPKMREMSNNYVPLMTGRGIEGIYPIWSSLLFGLAIFAAALLYFSRKDY